MTTTKTVAVPNGITVMRVRFTVPYQKPDGSYDKDYRPIKWPIPHPYWCTGTNDTASVIVAYVESQDQLLEYWPEAEHIETLDAPTHEYTFTDRFEQPHWLKL